MDRDPSRRFNTLLKLKKRYWKYKNSRPEGENQYIGEIKNIIAFF